MDVTFVTEYISPIALVICLAVGYIIKNLIANETIDRFIPCIVGILGIAICAWVEWSITPQVIALGLISGLASTGLYEAFKQIIGLKGKSDEEATGRE
jgi:hypothetical protein